LRRLRIRGAKFSVTENVHDPPGDREAPEKVRNVSPAEPVSELPGPHGGSGDGGSVAVRPVSVAAVSPVTVATGGASVGAVPEAAVARKIS
jgi:hypothetical protein